MALASCLPRLSWPLFLALAVAVSPVHHAFAANDGARTEFVLPALPLAEALRRFSRAYGFDAVFPEALVEGRMAPAIRSSDSPHHTLDRLLAGSGLVVRFTRPDAFILEPFTQTAAADIALDRIEILTPVLDDGGAVYRWYGDKVLDASLRKLRRSRELGMLAYDFTLYLWVSDTGTVTDLRGVSTPEQETILHTAIGMLRGLAIGSVPPPDMPQPVGLRINAQ